MIMARELQLQKLPRLLTPSQVVNVEYMGESTLKDFRDFLKNGVRRNEMGKPNQMLGKLFLPSSNRRSKHRWLEKYWRRNQMMEQ